MGEINKRPIRLSARGPSKVTAANTVIRRLSRAFAAAMDRRCIEGKALAQVIGSDGGHVSRCRDEFNATLPNGKHIALMCLSDDEATRKLGRDCVRALAEASGLTVSEDVPAIGPELPRLATVGRESAEAVGVSLNALEDGHKSLAELVTVEREHTEAGDAHYREARAARAEIERRRHCG